MATERYEYAAADETGHYVMPERMASAVAWVVPEVTMWRRVVRIDGVRVTHGEWHEVETAAGGGS